MYVMMSDGRILNRYEIKINNKASEPKRFELSVSGVKGAKLELGQENPVKVEPESSSIVLAKVIIRNDEKANTRTYVTFKLQDVTDRTKPALTKTSVFSLPPR